MSSRSEDFFADSSPTPLPTLSKGTEELAEKLQKQREDQRSKNAEYFDGKYTPAMLMFEDGAHGVLEDYQYTILAMYLSGEMSVFDISKKLGFSIHSIHKIINSAAGQEIINRWKDLMKLELQALYGKVLKAIREGLDSKDKEIQAKAIDKFHKMLFDKGNEGGGGNNVTINIANNARTRFIESIRDASQVKVKDMGDAEFDTL